jgi:hypothetical protein
MIQKNPKKEKKCFGKNFFWLYGGLHAVKNEPINKSTISQKNFILLVKFLTWSKLVNIKKLSETHSFYSYLR